MLHWQNRSLCKWSLKKKCSMNMLKTFISCIN
ncbi:hypothetical protein KEN51_CDS0390 [Pseudomonas phage vB_Pae10145-KEN51]|nr:hypothetical protein [Pseudomonas phage ANB1]WNV50445.1 hypothetical protein [Pseudomonas phage PhiPizzaParty]WRQ05829.1 hypothetical protein IPCDMZAV_CDS0306 [Pseudomonas phage 6B]WRQ06326.1 hypothetical protein QAMIJHJT_CDS0395 [Pseudomonas phage 9-Ps-8B]WRQ06734.1 hypothetical protein FOPPYZMZ_CDS0394 [Pseudomonas phage 9Ps-7B]WRQ07085.1 hypothetical protein ZBUARNPM_CDS0336 [Pseudomonas phage 14Ps5-6]